MAIINGPANAGRAHVSNAVDDGMVGGPRGCTRPNLSHMGQSIVVLQKKSSYLILIRAFYVWEVEHVS